MWEFFENSKQSRSLSHLLPCCSDTVFLECSLLGTWARIRWGWQQQQGCWWVEARKAVFVHVLVSEKGKWFFGVWFLAEPVFGGGWCGDQITIIPRRLPWPAAREQWLDYYIFQLASALLLFMSVSRVSTICIWVFGHCKPLSYLLALWQSNHQFSSV